MTEGRREFSPQFKAEAADGDRDRKQPRVGGCAA